MIIRSKHDLKQHLRRLERFATRYDGFLFDCVYRVFAYSNDVWYSLCSEFKPVTFYSTVPESTWLDWCSKDREIDQVRKFFRFESSPNLLTTVTLIEMAESDVHLANWELYSRPIYAELEKRFASADLPLPELSFFLHSNPSIGRISDGAVRVNNNVTTIFEIGYSQSWPSLVDDALLWHSLKHPLIITAKITVYDKHLKRPHFTYRVKVWDLTPQEWAKVHQLNEEYKAALKTGHNVHVCLKRLVDVTQRGTEVWSNFARRKCVHITASGQRSLTVPLAPTELPGYSPLARI